MKVVEIFDSIQGEGEFMGIMCTFIRFPGCNLKCPFCDEHEKYSKAVEMNMTDIVAKCKQYRVVLTGGEPTLQPSLDELVNKLHEAHHAVSIETNGTDAVPEAIDWVTCSPKAPKYELPYTGYHEIKLVVSEDLTISKALDIALYTGKFVWLQPCDGPWLEQSKKRIIEWIQEFPEKFRAGIQLHKYYGVV